MRLLLLRSFRGLMLLSTSIGTTAGPAAGGPAIAGNLAGELALSAWKGAPPLAWKIGFKDGQFDVTLRGEGLELHATLAAGPGGGAIPWSVDSGAVALKTWSQGMLTAGRATVSGSGTWRDGRVDGKLRFGLHDLSLGELVRLGDPERKKIRSADGRVEGQITLRLNGDGTANLADSNLQLAPGTTGLVAFVPTPGLLTGYVPAAAQKKYPGLGAMERGETPLEATVLSLSYFAGSDAQGRAATVRLEGHPQDRRQVAPLVLDLNLTGPVERLVRQMSDSRLHFGGGGK